MPCAACLAEVSWEPDAEVSWDAGGKALADSQAPDQKRSQVGSAPLLSGKWLPSLRALTQLFGPSAG